VSKIQKHRSSSSGWVVFLGFSLFVSAFCVVYVKDYNRRLNASIQRLLKAQEDAQLAHERLLLEQATFSSSGRISRLAEGRLGMHVPRSQEMTVLSVGQLPGEGGS